MATPRMKTSEFLTVESGTLNPADARMRTLRLENQDDYDRSALLKSSLRSWTSEGLASPRTKYQRPPSAHVSVLKASFLLSEDPEFNPLNSARFWNMNTEI